METGTKIILLAPIARGKKGEFKKEFENLQTQEKTLCLVDALHDSYYACGYADGKPSYAPAYIAEEEVLALAAEGYRLRACGALPLQEKAAVDIVSPEIGLVGATIALAKKQAFGDLTALYVRKSSAELNQGK